MNERNHKTVDKTPEGHKQEACQTASGEVFVEYGVVDLTTNFPSEDFTWQPEFDPKEQHVVVPFRVARRGLKGYREARKVAEVMEEERDGQYRAVILSDTRGL